MNRKTLALIFMSKFSGMIIQKKLKKSAKPTYGNLNYVHFIFEILKMKARRSYL